MSQEHERRIAALEDQMKGTRKLLDETVILVNTQAVQMGIVWGVMKVGFGAVLLAVLGLVLSAAFGKPVHLTGGG